MPEYTAIVRSLAPEKFAEVFSASARRARETYFQRHGIRKPRTLSGLPKAGAKTEARTAELFRTLQKKDDEELVEEVLRTWLLSKRSMLAAALDHLAIPHDNGLTDSEDLSRFENLEPAEVVALAAKLRETAPSEEVAIYLKFMGAKDVDAALAGGAPAADRDAGERAEQC